MTHPTNECKNMQMNKENSYKISIKVEANGKERTYEAHAIAHSCFFQNTKLYLFADGVIWSNIQPEDLLSDTKVQNQYLTMEGLKERIELPNEIVSSFKEALGCYLSGYHNASVVLSRKLLEGVLIKKGAFPNQRVCDMIKELVKRGILDDKLKNLADEIKYLGNVGAHMKEEDANKADAEQALHFCDFLVTWLFGEVDTISKAYKP